MKSPIHSQRITFFILGLANLCWASSLRFSSERRQLDASATSSLESFLWGAAAAYLIEGGVNEGGRGESIWDVFSAIPGKVSNGDTGVIADNSFHQYMEDVEMLKNSGLSAYRFSIAWPRIVPDGATIDGTSHQPGGARNNGINRAGIEYYSELIDALLEAGIEPVVTLYHWDLPQALEERYEGWLSDKVVKDFRTFADICFSEFGSRVKKWITLNEPWTICLNGYITGAFAPGRCSDRSKCAKGDSVREGYLAAHNMLNAHASAVDLYRAVYKAQQGGIIGITLNHDWAEPLRPHVASDVAAAERRNEFAMGWFNDPINFGDYPASMREYIDGDRLPVFTPEQRTLLIKSYDFLGLNHYSSKYFYDARESPPPAIPDPSKTRLTAVADEDAEEKEGVSGAQVEPVFTPDSLGWGGDQMTVESKYNMAGEIIGPQAESPWLQVVPWGFYNVIMWSHLRYSRGRKNISRGSSSSLKKEEKGEMSVVPSVDVFAEPILIYITENGCDAPGETEMAIEQALNDTFRVDYFKKYLAQMERAMQDGANVAGYFAWSLMDNFEWVDGYSKRFGLYYVDYNDPTRSRYAKKSALWYRDYAASHPLLPRLDTLPDTTNPDTVDPVGKISTGTPLPAGEGENKEEEESPLSLVTAVADQVHDVAQGVADGVRDKVKDGEKEGENEVEKEVQVAARGWLDFLWEAIEQHIGNPYCVTPFTYD